MKPIHFLAFAISSLSLVACTDVDTVYVGGGQGDLGDRCAIEPGSNVCDRQFVLRSGDDIGPFRDDLQLVSDFAGLAEQMVREVLGACRGIVAETTGAVIAVPSDATPKDQLRVVCPAAAEALRMAEPGALQVTVTPASCTEVSTRRCSSLASAPFPYCSTPGVTVTTSPSATSEAVAVGAALSHHFGRIFATKARLEQMAVLTGEITRAAPIAPDECAVSVSTLAVSAVDDVGAVVSATGSLTAQLNVTISTASQAGATSP